MSEILILNDAGVGGLLDAGYPESQERTESLIARLTHAAFDLSGKPVELVLRPETPALHGHNRTLRDVRDWITERKASERRDAPKNQNTPAAGMTMGAIETLDALSAYLNGDDDA